MPQGNLESLVSVCAGGSCDNKIVCETLATTDGDADDHRHATVQRDEEEIPPDIPPESFWLSKDAELDWFDRNAFYERKESQKGNSASNSTNLNPGLNSNSNSQRFSVRKSKASLIGLPKPQKFVETKNRKNCKIGNTRLFPKRSGSVKSDPPLVEPSSPKVSCMGRVRSRRDRNRRLKKNRQKSAEVETVKEKTTRKRSGFFSSFRAIFGSNGKARDSHALPVEPSPPRNSDIRMRLPPDDRDVIATAPEIAENKPVVEPVGLGGMKRFASGRRSEPLI